MHGQELIAGIRASLKAAGDPERARSVQAYMKSEMPSLGVPVPEVRRIVKAAAKASPFTSGAELRDTVLRLWREAGAREERYAAIDLTAARLVATDLQMVPVYEEFIRSGAWWDLVDGVSPRIRELLLAHPDGMAELMLRWAADGDMWVRRAAITSQVGAKARTNRTLLAAVILPNLADREFFIRKAIGWALREYSKSDPEWVAGFVAEHKERLSTLSYREAVRRLPAVSGAK
ncbi:DNA alkylation repair protein [Arthrobacter silvisoli]|uniref:DNA alkylation repair protein n=1 Tax=Arthrobacter silvisoli TaxID=2291022 RepID=UPI000E213619|nr:DNA alkylation repair protein [Arthrobacter silvisoli]